MRRGDDGVWRVEGRASWRDAAYRYAVTVYVPTLDQVVTNVVTDPYSLALTTNSARSVLADLDDPALEPRGWRAAQARLRAARGLDDLRAAHPRLLDHRRDRPAAHRGTYLAFTDRGSAGMRQLRDLAARG